ncbi:hypothetical protein BHM03_00001504 [Ensete ventricosum]|uniref:Uncharacterized protein n=1 Tax=Ensete ventricosum TaxID=4639 RepID=A0A445M962_ENSVE|nr:hypothetical protein BHM03_00001504 [Ensete ventricosum]
MRWRASVVRVPVRCTWQTRGAVVPEAAAASHASSCPQARTGRWRKEPEELWDRVATDDGGAALSQLERTTRGDCYFDGGVASAELVCSVSKAAVAAVEEADLMVEEVGAGAAGEAQEEVRNDEELGLGLTLGRRGMGSRCWSRGALLAHLDRQELHLAGSARLPDVPNRLLALLVLRHQPGMNRLFNHSKDSTSNSLKKTNLNSGVNSTSDALNSALNSYLHNLTPWTSIEFDLNAAPGFQSFNKASEAIGSSPGITPGNRMSYP